RARACPGAGARRAKRALPRARRGAVRRTWGRGVLLHGWGFREAREQVVFGAERPGAVRSGREVPPKRFRRARGLAEAVKEHPAREVGRELRVAAREGVHRREAMRVALSRRAALRVA